MINDPSLSDLRLFCVVARRASFAGGAREAGVSQALASKRVAQLERALGVTLLRRTTRKVSLTDEGQRVLDWAQRILEDVDDMRDELSRAAREPQGPIRVSSSARLGREVVAPALSALKRRYPGIDIWLELLDRRVDLVGESFHLDVRAGEVAEPHLIGHLIARNAHIVCAAPSYLARRGVPQTLSDLAAHDCVLLREREEPFGLWRLSGPDGLEQVKVKGPLASNDIDVVLRWARDGFGLVKASQWLLAPSLAQGALVRVLPQYEHSAHIHAVSTVRSAQSAKVRLCVQALRQQMDPTMAYTDDNRQSR
ncbi:LysR family transcriptional regulator [Caldimonas manganoxidans]|uniref:LysR family transcriptional regulator n=1 Tax=Caldimonas manganoxidans TaxID=196015 RepID=UPI0003737F78|nr:LysR substrate-binding domain-containing protein [Caldimonas manganoxidans]